MPTLHVTDRDGREHTLDLPSGQPLMFLLRDEAGLPVEGLCGGCAACGTCHVFIDAAWRDRLPAMQDDEAGMLEQLEHRNIETSRLSCQIAVTDDLDGLKLTLAPEE